MSMAHSPRYDTCLAAAWRDLLTSVAALGVELKAAPPGAMGVGATRAAGVARARPAPVAAGDGYL